MNCFLGSIPSPTLLAVFGFDGPTNRHNLDGAYLERRSERALGDQQAFDAIIEDAYRECLTELETP